MENTQVPVQSSAPVPLSQTQQAQQVQAQPVQTQSAQPQPAQKQPVDQLQGKPLSAVQINFLKDRRRSVEKLQEKDRKIASYSGIALGVFLLISVVILVLSFITASQEKKIQSQINAAQVQLKSTIPIQKEYVVYASKLGYLFGIDLERQAKRQAASYFYSIIPSDSVLSDITLNEAAHSIEFEIQTPQVFSLARLLTALFMDDVTKRGYTITAASLSRKADGTYTLTGKMVYTVQKVTPVLQKAKPAKTSASPASQAK